MSIHNRKEREKQELRKKIFETASHIILEQGYEKLSMRKIAEKIEYSPTILYHYFTDKADIVNQIILETYRDCVDKVKDEMERNAHQDASVQLRAGIKTYVHTLTANAQQFRAVLLSGGNMAMPDPDASRESGLDVMEQVLQKGVEQQIFHTLTPMTSQIIISAVFGLVFHIIGHGIDDYETIDRMAEECAEILLSGLTAYKIGGQE